jgi:hypothetical protein
LPTAAQVALATVERNGPGAWRKIVTDLAEASLPPATVEQHSLARSVTLHLLPGLLGLFFYFVAVPLLSRAELPSGLAAHLAITFVVIPCQLVVLLNAAWQPNGALSFRSVVLNRDDASIGKQFVLVVRNREFVSISKAFVFAAGLAVWTGLAVIATPLVDVYLSVAWDMTLPFEQLLNRHATVLTWFAWLPFDGLFWASPFGHLQEHNQRLILPLATISIGLVFPVVEELYFRGFLMPRQSRLGFAAPLVSGVLSALYLFMLPWEFPARLLTLLPIAWAVWVTKNLYLGMVARVVGPLIATWLAYSSVLGFFCCN